MKMSKIVIIFSVIVLVSLVLSCTPAATSQISTTSPSGVTSQEPTTQEPSTATLSTATTAPTTTTEAAVAKPQGEVTGALQSYGNENWLPWLDPDMANLHDVVYDVLIYYDTPDHRFIPGLAESWDLSADAMTLTYHLRKGIQFSDGWGEFTSADVKYNFEMQASKFSIGKVAQTRRIESMDAPDAYTLVVHFKDPFPTFWAELSFGNSGVCQGIVCKKYLETVGEDEASQKPIGTGPYRLVESQTGSYFKFDAVDSHWRVVPEFKTLTVRLIPEVSSLIAALKNKEIDMAQVPADQLEDLKAAGVAVEVAPGGGNVIVAALGGMFIPEDKRYDAAIHNKDPWVDSKVRKAMAISIDREAICKAIYNGYANPASVPVFSAVFDKYQYPFDPDAAKQLLKDAGYPNGFSFKMISFTQPGYPEMPRMVEALSGYWQQIGLDPEISVVDFNTYNNRYRSPGKTAGEISLGGVAPVADVLSRVEMSLIPNVTQPFFEDEGSYAIYKAMPKTATIEERTLCVDQLNEYYFENVGPIPVIRTGYCYGWNSDKISAWPHPPSLRPFYFDYIRHAQPINTFRLFSPWTGR